jgi:hypothetical protein
MPIFTSKALYAAVFLSVSIIFNAKGQEKTDTISRDYVINLKGDTIKGRILWINDGALKIDPFSETHTVKYKTGDIKEACQTGVVYVPIKANLMFHDVLFAKRIQHGAIDLFEYHRETPSYYSGGLMVGGSSQTIWYAAKTGEPAAEIKTTGIGNMSRAERKKNFMALIVDDDTLAKEFEAKNDYSIDYLRDVIKRYNQQYSGRNKN